MELHKTELNKHKFSNQNVLKPGFRNKHLTTTPS